MLFAAIWGLSVCLRLLKPLRSVEGIQWGQYKVLHKRLKQPSTKAAR